MFPLISVIVPVYKAATYLRQCVQSVLKQDYSQFELILIDDGSPDESGKLCDEYAQKDTRIRVFHQPNQGTAAARNCGIEAAKGDYITFLDADDYLLSGALSYLLSLLEEHDAEISIANFYTVYQNRKTPWRKPDEKTECLSGIEAVENLLYTVDFDASTWGKLYRSSIFQKFRYPINHLYEDVASTYQILLGANRVAVGHEPKYCYVKHPLSVVTSPFQISNMDMLDVCRDIFSYVYRHELTDLYPAARRKLLYACFYLLKTMGDSYKQYPQECKELMCIYRQQRRSVFLDPKAPKRDKAAILCLTMGIPFFQWAWKAYQAALGRRIS